MKSFVKSMLKLAASIWVVIISTVLCLTMLALIVGAIAYSFSGGGVEGGGETQHMFGNADSDNKLLSIKISGPIIGDEDDINMAGGEAMVSGYAIKQQLFDAASDDSIKGIVLEINSPGGTIYGAHAIADGVAEYRKQTRKPVIAYVQGLAASGAYWAAASADEIIADYGSDVGDIGVIAGPFEYYDKVLGNEGGVVTQNGIQSTVITAGKSKDIGNPYRRLTNDELKILQQSVNNDYDLFVSYVSQRRGIEESVIRDKIGALPYDNKTAQAYKLINSSGNREDAYYKLAGHAKLEDDDYEVIRNYPLTDMSDPSLATQVLGHKNKRQAHAYNCTLNHVTLAYSGDASNLCK